MIDLALAPGCFGGPLLYRPEAIECKSCPFKEVCAPEAAARLLALRDRLGIKPAPVEVKSTAAPGETPIADPTARTIPIKVVKLLKDIERAGIKITEALRENRNPFDTHKTDRLAFMYWACQVARAFPKGVTRKAVENVVSRRIPRWSPAMVTTHVAQAFHALQAVGAADVVDGVLVLRRE